MRVAVDAPDLRAALDRAARVVDGRSPIQVYRCVRISADGDTLRVTADSGAVRVSVDVPAKVDAAGEVAIPGPEVTAFVKLASGAVRIDADDTSAALRFGRSVAHIAAVPLADFPAGAAADVPMCDVDGGVLADALRFVSPAMSREETRYYLIGVYVCATDGDGDLVATNGSQLHHARIPGVTLGDGIVPAAAIPLIAEIAAAAKGVVRFGVSGSRWRIDAPGVSAQGATVDGAFPDWRRIMAAMDQRKVVAVVDAKEAAAAVKIATIGSAEARVTSGISIAAEGDAVTFSGATLGKAVRETAASISADVRRAITFGLSADYLADAISAASSDSVAIMAVGGPDEPVDFEPAAQRADLRKVCRVMPMRLNVLAARAMAAE